MTNLNPVIESITNQHFPLTGSGCVVTESGYIRKMTPEEAKEWRQMAEDDMRYETETNPIQN